MGLRGADHLLVEDPDVAIGGLVNQDLVEVTVAAAGVFDVGVEVLEERRVSLGFILLEHIGE